MAFESPQFSDNKPNASNRLAVLRSKVAGFLNRILFAPNKQSVPSSGEMVSPLTTIPQPANRVEVADMNAHAIGSPKYSGLEQRRNIETYRTPDGGIIQMAEPSLSDLESKNPHALDSLATNSTYHNGIRYSGVPISPAEHNDNFMPITAPTGLPVNPAEQIRVRQ